MWGLRGNGVELTDINIDSILEHHTICCVFTVHRRLKDLRCLKGNPVRNFSAKRAQIFNSGAAPATVSGELLLRKNSHWETGKAKATTTRESGDLPF